MTGLPTKRQTTNSNNSHAGKVGSVGQALKNANSGNGALRFIKKHINHIVLVMYLVTVPANITMTIPKTKHKKAERDNRKYIT